MEQLQSPKKVAGHDATAAFWNDFAPNYMKAEIINIVKDLKFESAPTHLVFQIH